MPVVVLLIVLVVIALLLYKSVQDARRQAGAAGAEGPAPAPAPKPQRSRPRPRSKPRQPKPKVDEEALAAHVTKLRAAIDGGFISVEEAVGSVLRQTDGALGEDAARKLLEQDDAA